MNKTIILLILLPFLIISCDKLNSPDDYIGIPSKIRISKVEYDDANNYYIYLVWDKYKTQFNKYKLTRDNEIIATILPNSNSYMDIVKKGIYEYRLYIIKDDNVSIPSYIKIKIDTKTYEWWY